MRERSGALPARPRRQGLQQKVLPRDSLPLPNLTAVSTPPLGKSLLISVVQPAAAPSFHCRRGRIHRGPMDLHPMAACSPAGYMAAGPAGPALCWPDRLISEHFDLFLISRKVITASDLF
jgi:hypothetical protein